MNSKLKEIGTWLTNHIEMDFINENVMNHPFIMDNLMISEFIRVMGETLHLDNGSFQKSIQPWTKKSADLFYGRQKGIETAFEELSFLRQEIWSRLEHGYKQGAFGDADVFLLGSVLIKNNDSTVNYLSKAFVEKYREEFVQKEKLLEEQESVIAELAVPMIPSIIPSTVLIPLTGDLSVDRLEQIRTKLLFSVASQRMTTVVIDFTGITSLQVSMLGVQELALQIEQLTASLRLMGVDAILAGFSTELSQGIVQAGIQLNVPVFSSFRSSLTYLVNQKKLTIDDLTT